MNICRYSINCDVIIQIMNESIYINPIVGQSDVVQTPQEAIDRCMELRYNGVQIPEHVIEKLRRLL